MLNEFVGNLILDSQLTVISIARSLQIKYHSLMCHAKPCKTNHFHALILTNSH